MKWGLSHLNIAVALFMLVFLFAAPGHGQTAGENHDADFKIALPTHPGQLQWHADGFLITQMSVEPKAQEIGIRGQDQTGHLFFVGFLSLTAGPEPLTGAQCRDSAIESEKRSDATFKAGATSQLARPDGPPVELVNYQEVDEHGKAAYSERGFIADGDLCGDLEIYSNAPIADSPAIKKIWQTFTLNPNYDPQFDDIFQYAQVLFQSQKYAASGPLFEQALTKVKDDGSSDSKTWRRVATDQAGMSYGVGGDIPRGRAIFEAAIVKDPDYPMYYYNLACADAGENKLDDARGHLQQAFARKANVIPGETVPDPTKDESFQPYKDNADFWAFLESLH
jgi:tetratricopeptide (TPR) repeat protein